MQSSSTDNNTVNTPMAAPPSPEGSGAEHELKERKLRTYAAHKLALAAQLRSLREIFKSRQKEREARRCDQLMRKLAEDRFTLAVLGQFKRGKSSLMNAVIGREILPIGVLPLTSAITILRFGAKERLLIRHAHWTFEHEVPLEQLADYVTENGNPGNRQQVEAAYLEMPLPFLRRGLEFVDTPGVGSAIGANTATTHQFLPACDAAIFVTSADSPLTGTELEFLRTIRQHARKLFFVINKIDVLAPPERVQLVEFVRRTIGQAMGTGIVQVFAVSAREGLAAKARGDGAAYQLSGMGELEDALARFLTDEKAEVFLTSILEKVTQLATQESAETELRRRVRDVPESTLHERRQRFEKRLKEIVDERSRILCDLRARFVDQFLTRWAADFDGWIDAQEPICARLIDRLIPCSRWQFAAISRRRISDAIARQLDRHARSWAASRLPQLSSECAPQGTDDLLRNLNAAIPAMADLIGVRQSVAPDADLLPPWQPATFAIPPVEPEPTGLPSFWRWWPSVLVRGKIRENLRKHLASWLRSYRESVAAYVARLNGEAFDRWSAELQRSAAEADTSAVAALADHPVGDGQNAPTSLARVIENLNRLRTEIAAGNGPERASSGEEQTSDDSAGQPQLETSELKIDLPRELRTRGCPACDHLANVAFAYFSKLQHALYSNESVQNTFADEMGLCPVHVWQLEAVSSPVGMSVGYAKWAEHTAKLLRRAAKATHEQRVVPRLPRVCRVCELQREAEEDYLTQLVAFIRDLTGRETFRRSQGLCLRHLSRILDLAVDDESVTFLLTHAAEHFEELAEDMNSFGMKTEALRRELRHSDEEDAFIRALVHLAGSRRVCCAVSCDGEI